MEIVYDAYNRPEPSKVFIAKPDNTIICCIGGIDESSFSLTLKANNCSEATFNVYRYINGEASDGYDFITNRMRIYITHIGWFILDEPTTYNDGNKEYKAVTASSIDSEFLQHNLENFKINCGTTDSREMLVEDNVEVVDEVEFAKEQIKFYNPDKPELSLLNLLIETEPEWTIGYVDPIAKTYEFYDSEKDVFYTQTVKLADEIGKFEVDYESIYAFITQELEEYFQCIIYFDINNKTVNAYRIENIGEDTNINISFRNFQDSNNISKYEDIYTVYNVAGGDDLNINYWNFGSSRIENIDWYLNETYMSGDLVKKYKAWRNFTSSKRKSFANLTKKYNKQLEVVSELKNRVPLDGCSEEWNKLSDDQLAEAKTTYETMKKGYEAYYVDSDGNFDVNALNASTDANDYWQIVDVILPSIEVEYYNRGLPTSEGMKDYVETYKTDWKLYGVDELQVRISEYQDKLYILEKNGYDLTYDEYSKLAEDGSTTYTAHTKDMHDTNHALYVNTKNQLDETYSGSCAEALKNRTEEYDTANKTLEEINTERTAITTAVDKTTWSNDEYGKFTDAELATLQALYNETNYQNENIFVISVDNNDSDIIGAEYELYKDAVDELAKKAQPNYQYQTTLENLLALYDYKDWSQRLGLFNFLWLSVRDDYVVKLRVIEISFNPLTMDSKLTLSFSNMLGAGAKRNDFVSLLNSSSGVTNSAVTQYGNSTVDDSTYTLLTQGLLEKILSSSALNSKINNAVNNGGIGSNGGYMNISSASGDIVSLIAGTINAENGIFQYLQSQLISAGKVVAENADFKTLSALTANIDNLISGKITAEEFHALNLTANNVTISDAVIADLIAARITVSMLKAGTITTDSFNIESENGRFSIVGDTLQIKDADGNTRIQMGEDANGDFTFTIYDATGTGVLIDSTGVKETAIADGLIKNDMLAGGITKDKLGFNIVEADENGNISSSAIVTADGSGIDAKFTSIEKQIQDVSSPVIVTINSSAGMVFVDGEGTTTLTCKLTQDGVEIDSEGVVYTYKWYKYDQSGNLVSDFGGTGIDYKTGKSITVSSGDIDKTNTFTVEVDENNVGN